VQSCAHFVKPTTLVPAVSLLLRADPHPQLHALQDDKVTRLLSGSLSQNYDAVIGSLPRGLSTDERMRIKQSAPMSPALGALHELPLVSWGNWRGLWCARAAAAFWSVASWSCPALIRDCAGQGRLALGRGTQAAARRAQGQRGGLHHCR
jgi:hypothetical protein